MEMMCLSKGTCLSKRLTFVGLDDSNCLSLLEAEDGKGLWFLYDMCRYQ